MKGTLDNLVAATADALQTSSDQRLINDTPLLNKNKRDQVVDRLVTVLASAPWLRFRNAYNLTTMSITRAEFCRGDPQAHSNILAYHVDPVRQSIADTVPHSLDASVARQDRNFSPWYDLAAMMADMRERLGARINARKIGA